jgi:hypothetical protein
MQLENIVRHLGVLLRADAIIADIEFRSRSAQLAYRAAALLVALFGLVMFGIAGFFALSVIWGPAWAAAAIGAAFAAIALLLLVIAAGSRPHRELKLAMEVHRAALDGLVLETRRAGEQFTAAGNLFRHPLESSLPSLIVPLISLLLKALGKSGKAAPPSA